MIDDAIDELTPIVGTTAALAAVGVDRATWYRQHRQSPAPPSAPNGSPPLSPGPSPRSSASRSRRSSSPTSSSTRPRPPSTPSCSTRGPTWPRSPPCTGSCTSTTRCVNAAARPPTPPTRNPSSSPPRPNSVWSWDITKLHGPEKWTYYYLYVILDIYSRYVVGWMLARAERAELSKRLINDTIAKQGVAKDQLTTALGPRVAHDRQTGGPSAWPTWG